MSKILDTIKTYAVSVDSDFHLFLNRKNKREIIKLLCDILDMYITDKNSSTIREKIIISMAGYTDISQKLGYNGYKSTRNVSSFCEAKPQNVERDGKRKLTGGGSFNDYTWKRFEKHIKENPQIVIGGFVDGELIFIFEIQFNDIADKMKDHLKKILPDGDKPRSYARSPAFSISDYENADVKIHYVVTKDRLEYFKKNISRKLFTFLMGLIDD